MRLTPFLVAVTFAPLLFSLASCEAEGGSGALSVEEVQVRISSADSVGAWTLEMSHSPTTLGESFRREALLPLSLVGRTNPDGPVALAAVPSASLAADGSIVVADRLAKKVLLLDSTMALIRTIGREGPGPAEFRGPAAVLALDSTLVSFQYDRQRTLQVFTLDGKLSSVFPPPVPGDWFRIAGRAPSLYQDVQRGGLDTPARRLFRWDSISFAFILHDDEYSSGAVFPDGVPEVDAHVLRLSFEGAVLDTVATAPASRLAIFQKLPAWDLLGSEIYGYRPLWAFGTDWMAYGSRNGVKVQWKTGDLRGRVVWPDDTRRLTEEDQKTFLGVWVDLQLLYSDGAREVWDRLNRSEQGRTEDALITQWTFAEKLPTIMELLATGDCLWLAGWSGDGAPDGTSRRWMILNLRSLEVVGLVELPGYLPRLRDVRGNRALVSTIGSEGVPELSLYSLADLDCG